MIKRADERLGLKPERLAVDTAYGTGKFLHWLIGTSITPHIPVWDMSKRDPAPVAQTFFVDGKLLPERDRMYDGSSAHQRGLS
jgi:hypothetical protein